MGFFSTLAAAVTSLSLSLVVHLHGVPHLVPEPKVVESCDCPNLTAANCDVPAAPGWTLSEVATAILLAVVAGIFATRRADPAQGRARRARVVRFDGVRS